METDPALETIHIDVYFQSTWFIKYQTHMRFTFVELLGIFRINFLVPSLNQSINIL